MNRYTCLSCSIKSYFAKSRSVKSRSVKSRSANVVGVLALSFTALLSGAFAKDARAQQLPPLPIEFNPDNLINPGRPGGRRRGGGSRGGCQAGVPLSAITYAESWVTEELGVTITEEAVGMLTTQVQPMLWFYVPAEVGDMATEFIVKDTQGLVVYQGRLSGQTAGEGVIGVPLAAEMAVGSSYQWSLTVDCDETERVTVGGWVERRAVGPDTVRSLTQASARNRVALYANYGFLQDAVGQLAELRLARPEDEAIAQSWRQLLTALELPELADATVFSCCDVTTEPLELPEAIEEEEIPDTPQPVEEPDVERASRSVLERARDRGN